MLDSFFTACSGWLSATLASGPGYGVIDWLLLAAALVGYGAWLFIIGRFLGLSLQYWLLRRVLTKPLPFVADLQKQALAHGKKHIAPKWKAQYVKKAWRANRLGIISLVLLFMLGAVDPDPFWSVVLPGLLLFLYWSQTFSKQK